MQKRMLNCMLGMHCYTLQVHNMLLHISVPSHNMAASPDVMQGLVTCSQMTDIKQKVKNHTQCLLHKKLLNGPAKIKSLEHNTQYNDNVNIRFIYWSQFRILTTMSHFTIFQLWSSQLYTVRIIW
jgi:hypothetical protein